jgi:hypothetical protein
MKKILILISYLLIFFYSNLFANENGKKLKIGLLAPFSGEYSNLGNSMMFSLQLALDEIGDENVVIIPRDSGFKNKIKLNNSIKEIINQGANIIIGPINSEDFDQVHSYKDIIFISPSNMKSEINNNVISIGINLDSQLLALKKFIKKENKKKTVILYPDNEYSKLVETAIKDLNFKPYKLFKYSSDPKILTGEIEKLSNYSQRKRNLDLRKKILSKKDDIASERELKKLEQRYTLGKVGFDSLIVIDFGNSLKSVLASLVFADVDEKDVVFMTVNQWFDESIFYENSVKTLYYPSINLKNFNKYNKRYFNNFKFQPSEITILSYEALGLIYYVWKKNNNTLSIKDFLLKDDIKGKIGTFSFKNNKTIQKLDIYKAEKNNFTKI